MGLKKKIKNVERRLDGYTCQTNDIIRAFT